MKKMMTVAITALTLLGSVSAFAGGVHCKQCPAESRHCIPKVGCGNKDSQILALDQGCNYQSQTGDQFALRTEQVPVRLSTSVKSLVSQN